MAVGFFPGGGIPEALADGHIHIDGKQQQQHNAQNPAEVAGEVGVETVNCGGNKEEKHRGFQGIPVHGAGPYSHGNGGNQGRVADDGADGVAVGNLAVARQGGGGGNHDLRQCGADGNHRSADDQIRHMEPLGDACGAVNKPVAAFDQQHKTQCEQQYRNKHSLKQLL